MFYKLSNTAKLKELEDYFNLPLHHHGLYQEKKVIDGLSENNLVVRTMENPDQLQFSIWGILPEQYTGDWKTFQKIKNTLNFNTDLLLKDECFKSSFEQRRCLILVTGFFTTYLVNGNAYPFYVYLSSKKPFCLGGIYNRLDDGFLTCSVLVTVNSKPLKNIQNLGSEMPLIINKSMSDQWLNKTLTNYDYETIMLQNENFLFETHPISDKLYKDKFDYDTILDPVEYEEILFTEE